jgi:hypothetical protein
MNPQYTTDTVRLRVHTKEITGFFIFTLSNNVTSSPALRYVVLVETRFPAKISLLHRLIILINLL